MQLPRFYINKLNIKRRRFLIDDPEEVKHLLVTRIRKGDKVVLFDGDGGEYLATVGFLSREQAAGVVEKEEFSVFPARPKIYLGQGMPRAGKLDDIIRMNTEAGVSGFVLFESEFSLAKKESFTAPKMERLERVAVQALRQSEGLFLPQFEGPFLYKEVAALSFTRFVLLHAREDKIARNIYEIKKEFKNDDRVLLLVGPEGGFSPQEVDFAKEHKFDLVFLNLPVMRTETAGIAASAILLS
jgi:16S rRNA (uracil1498-N3)-methyltransferase